MNVLVTGGAGFIGSNLVNHLSENKLINHNKIDKIVVIDNLSLGKKQYIQNSIDLGRVDFYKKDLLKLNTILDIFKRYKFDLVIHLAANSDISYGAKHTDWDLKQETLVTYNVLECMRLTGTKQIIFASTSAIYGEVHDKPIPEDYGPLHPISFYGAGKLACEALLSAFCHNLNIQVYIFRFANICGRNSTHGVFVNFIRELKTDPTALHVFGDGNQSKPYLHVDECINGVIYGYSHSKDTLNFYNLACNGATDVHKIANTIIQEMGLSNVQLHYTGGSRGWKGDVPFVRLNPNKLKAIGWSAQLTSDQAVQKAAQELIQQIKP